MKLVSKIENYLVNGFWLPINEEVEVLEEDVDKYLYLAGVEVVQEVKEVETEIQNN